MIIKRYWEPLGNPENIQDPVPKHFKGLDRHASEYPKIPNFGKVSDYVYRGGIVYSSQIGALRDKGVRHIISLLDGNWLKDGLFEIDDDITQHQFPILERKALTVEKITQIVDTMDDLEKRGEIMYVHCLKGAVRTGMVVAKYKIMKGKRTNLGAVVESMCYQNFNFSAIREILSYPKN